MPVSHRLRRHPSRETGEPIEPKRRERFQLRIEGHVRQHPTDCDGELRAVSGTGRRHDDARILWQPIDDELVAVIEAGIGLRRVRIETDIALHDRTCGAGDELGERGPDRLELGIISRWLPIIRADDAAVIVLRGFDAAPFEISGKP